SNDDRARVVSASSAQKQEAIGKWCDGRGQQLRPHARVPEVHGVYCSGREDMRFLHAEVVQISFLDLKERGIQGTTPTSPVCSEIDRHGILAGQVVVISTQPKIFLNRTFGIGTVGGRSGGPPVQEQLRTISFRPVTEKRQHAWFEISNLH